MARRLLSIWFPRLASDVSLRRRPVEGPFALAHRAGNADHLHCLNQTAQRRGLHRGMALADARAILPDLTVRPADLAAEAAALAALRRWAGRYAPMIAADGVDGLIADVTGVPHLFGGEEELIGDLTARVHRAGLALTCAIAGSRGGAHALARHGGGGIITDGNLASGLARLPVAALRIDHDTADALSRVGLARIGDLAPLPRAPLAKRFGQVLVLRLDQALGFQAEPVAAAPDAPHFGVRMTLPEPIGLHSDVMAALARLLDRLCEHLARHAKGARRLRLELRRVDHASAIVEVGLAIAMRDPRRIAEHFSRGVDAVDSGFGIDALRLIATVTEDMRPEQLAAGPAAAREADALADLISSLGNRLGFESITRFHPAQSLIPERSFLTLPAAYSEPARAFPHNPKRPIQLFAPEPATITRSQSLGAPPSAFRWRRMQFSTLRARGPERITPEWWLDDPAWRSGIRDYWRVETHEGPRLWLFHTPQAPGWYVQGQFA